MARFARVMLDQKTGRLFDYEIPAPLADAVSVGSRVAVPVRDRQINGTVVELLDEPSVATVKPIARLLGERPAIAPTLLRLADWIATYYCCPVEVAMRAILPQVIRNAKMTHKTIRSVRLARPIDPETLAALKRRAPRQAEVLEALAPFPDGVPLPALSERLHGAREAVAHLADKGLVATFDSAIARDPWRNESFVHHAPLELNAEQRVAFDAVRETVRAPGKTAPVLLHGVTGSGKTEIYLQAIQIALDAGRGAIMLVPEISLTPQTVERFKSRFLHSGTDVAVLHSHLSDGERHDEWHRIRDGRARIVIGARSAVFAPVQNLGLIVVDEEHENSYKQEEAPRYHGRDIAVVRGSFEPCAVLLGSATPSIESYQNAATGKYRLVELTQRVDDKKMPAIRVIDLRQETIKQKRHAIISDKLAAAIRLRIERGEQSILFLNRRGFSSSIICPKCGHVCKCPDCSLSLTFHRAAKRLVCHLCGHTEKSPPVCPSCSDPAIRFQGVGTERVEESLGALFPEAKVRRMDADTMTRKEAYRETLHAFKTGKIDILVGTQMIAKGLHFPNVTLVGIVNADSALHLADFRASERTFQLLVQVAGRAGRGDVEGEVIIQSFTPFHPAIQYAKRHDYAGFREQEIALRERCGFPPFTHLVLVTVRSPHESVAELSAKTLAKALDVDLPEGVKLLGPNPAPLERAHGQYRFQISLDSPKVLALSRHIRAVLNATPLPEETFAAVDVDPYQLL
jgi:primosomal protein N' (replication factor Y)